MKPLLHVKYVKNSESVNQWAAAATGDRGVPRSVPAVPVNNAQNIAHYLISLVTRNILLTMPSLNVVRTLADLGFRLKALRLQQNRTQDEVCGAVGLSRRALSAFESGSAPDVRLQTVFKLLRHFKCQLMVGPEANPRPRITPINRDRLAHIDNGLSFFEPVFKDLTNSTSGVSGVQPKVLAATSADGEPGGTTPRWSPSGATAACRRGRSRRTSRRCARR